MLQMMLAAKSNKKKDEHHSQIAKRKIISAKSIGCILPLRMESMYVDTTGQRPLTAWRSSSCLGIKAVSTLPSLKS